MLPKRFLSYDFPEITNIPGLIIYSDDFFAKIKSKRGSITFKQINEVVNYQAIFPCGVVYINKTVFEDIYTFERRDIRTSFSYFNVEIENSLPSNFLQ